ncbi:hypothetical protein ACLB2K_003536 [Fragaria x ananassa]
MEDLCENLWNEILSRLSLEKDLVPCMSVSKLWHRIASGLWVQKFWVQSPPLGLFFRCATTTTTYRTNYISLYNYHQMEDNLEKTRICVGVFYPYYDDNESYRDRKFLWQLSDRQWVKPLPTAQPITDRDEYLNGCNGLILMLKSATHEFYVCNPITGQQVAIPKPRVHQNQDHQHFCAALAFDPSESPHYYRVVRLDCSQESSSGSALMDIFSSEYGQWVRHRIQLDSVFIEEFQEFKLCRQFFYLRGKLYSISMSWKLLCIDVDAVEARALELPVPEADRTIGTMGCLGVSMDLLYYMKRMPDNSSPFDRQRIVYEKGGWRPRYRNENNLVVWYYDDESGKWVCRYSVSCFFLGSQMYYLGHDYEDVFEPYAISPSSDLLFYGTPNLILCYHLKSTKIKFVCETIPEAKMDTPACFLTLRACFVPFHTKLHKRNVDVSTPLATGFKDAKLLTVEVAQPGKQEDSEPVDVINVSLYDTLRRKHLPLPPLVYPSEITEMHIELGRRKPSTWDHCNATST